MPLARRYNGTPASPPSINHGGPDPALPLCMAASGCQTFPSSPPPSPVPTARTHTLELPLGQHQLPEVYQTILSRWTDTRRTAHPMLFGTSGSEPGEFNAARTGPCRGSELSAPFTLCPGMDLFSKVSQPVLSGPGLLLMDGETEAQGKHQKPDWQHALLGSGHTTVHEALVGPQTHCGRPRKGRILPPQGSSRCGALRQHGCASTPALSTALPALPLDRGTPGAKGHFGPQCAPAS